MISCDHSGRFPYFVNFVKNKPLIYLFPLFLFYKQNGHAIIKVQDI